MPAVGILLLMIQIAFAVHVVKTGREYFWIYIIIFVPVIGCAIYFFTQVLPELGSSQAARRTHNALIKAIDPQRELRNRKQQLELSDTIENRLKLADECLEAGFIQDAVEMYAACLKHGHEDDPTILLKYAGALFADKQPGKAREALEHLIAKNPGYRSPDGHLLYARCLEETGETQKALDEYAVLASSFPGEEGRVRYGLLLKKTGRVEEANKVFSEALERAKLAPRYYQKKEKSWLDIARQNL